MERTADIHALAIVIDSEEANDVAIDISREEPTKSDYFYTSANSLIKYH